MNLTARGDTPQPRKRPKSSYVRFAAEQPNERWQTDITHGLLADGAEICKWLDDQLRCCLASAPQPVFTAPAIDRLFRTVGALQAAAEGADATSSEIRVGLLLVGVQLGVRGATRYIRTRLSPG